MRAIDLGTRLRRHAGAVVVDNIWRGLAAAGRFAPGARPERHGVEIERDVPYLPSGSAAHTLDVYRPRERNGLAPVVLYVHGGGFRILSKNSHWGMGLAFARRGYVVFNISYRLAPRHPFPAGLSDVAAAYHWVLDNAARYGGDASRLVLAGESAGANLVTALTIAACQERDEPWARGVFARNHVPRATMPACGILQVSDPDRFRRGERPVSWFIHDRFIEVYEAYLGGSYAAGDPAYDLADPLCVLEGQRALDRPLPPFFAPCGTADPLLADTRRLAAALARRGVPCEAPEYEGELHAFHALVFRPNARRCWADTYRFLDRTLA
ncbi:MAG TPA: alpha/beta hydrolase [Nannocystaceae bacterium]|nr:alpha/beta hydrolase [Nannocystaceae bacterium]